MRSGRSSKVSMYDTNSEASDFVWVDPSQTPAMLGSMAGNAWSAFAAMPLLISAMGAVPWSAIEADVQAKTDARKEPIVDTQDSVVSTIIDTD